MGLTAKMTLLFNSLNALGLAAYGLLSVKAQVGEEMGAMDARLALAAQSYVRVAGEDRMDRAFRPAGAAARADGAAGEAYRADVAMMGDYAGELGLAYLYSVTVVGQKAKYVLDGAPQADIDGGDFKYPMDDYPDASPAVFAAWEKWAPQVDEYTDSFGSFRSYFLPAATGAGNRVIVGADVAIGDVRQKIKGIVARQARAALSIFAAGFAITFVFARAVAGRVIRIGAHVRYMAGTRDFTRAVAAGSMDEIGRMAAGINELQDVLREAIGRTFGASVSNAAHAQQFGAAAASIHGRVAASTLQVEQLNGHSGEINRHAAAAARMAASVQTDIGETNGQLTEAHGTLKELVAGANETAGNSRALAADLRDLNAKMGDVKRILETVTEISDQTDMLAINASIEAAQAGSVGKGFMVVADSVRGLASRTQETVGESDEIINQVVKGINRIIARMTEIVKANDRLAAASGRSLRDIASMHGRFAKTISMVAESAASSGRIEASVASMAAGLDSVASGVEATKAEAGEILDASAAIQGEADGMMDQLSKFAVGAPPPGARAE
jgi:methyl-accepting chemotaxis protein